MASWRIPYTRLDAWVVDFSATRLATTGVWLPAADAPAYAKTYVERLQAILDCGVLYATLRCSIVPVNADREGADPASDVNDAACLIFSALEEERRAVCWIPALDPTILLTVGDWADIGVDTTHASVAAFVTAIDGTDDDLRLDGDDHSTANALSKAYRQYREAIKESHSRRLKERKFLP